jgi:pyridoxine 5-phosphate synthase
MVGSSASMTKLSVNVNKLAVLRNSRGKNIPDVGEAARQILQWGAHGITVHPRPDGRHIRIRDVEELSLIVAQHRTNSGLEVEFNIEGYPSEDFLTLIERIKPDQATLVPDPPSALTSDAGWRVNENRDFLANVCLILKQCGVRSSLFIDPARCNDQEFAALASAKCDRIELYTESFSLHHGTKGQDSILGSYVTAAERARDMGLGINAGHDLNQKNLSTLTGAIPFINEVSIGHALISEALYDGLEKTVKNYLRILGWIK